MRQTRTPEELSDPDRSPIPGDIRPWVAMVERLLADAQRDLDEYWLRFASTAGTWLALGASYGDTLASNVLWCIGAAIGWPSLAVVVYRLRRRK